MRPELRLVEALASTFLAGELTVEGVIERGAQLLGRRWRWLPPLARRYVSTFSGRIRPRRRDVVDFLLADKRFLSVLSRFPFQLQVEHWLTESQRMHPVAAAAKWDVPPIESVAALAQWLGTDVNYLQWFADLKDMGSRTRVSKLRHYHYRVLAKDSGNIRLIEAPKQALKRLQQRILTGILDKVPAHPATHGFVRGRSIKTFVVPHVGQRVVLRMDLRDFFPTFRVARIRAFFRTLGYPEPVADLLAGMCTTATPKDIWKEVRVSGDPVQFWETKALYSRSHLPQGAPTSPALANLCAFRLDCRLVGLAASAGIRYTRYADDLAFSGNDTFALHVDRFWTHVAAILMEEGFTVNHRKTRIMRQSVRQRLAGLVTNQRPNVARKDFDRLKAILTNCVRHGPATQNREDHPQFRAHLEGRISFVEMVNPEKGGRLRGLFRQIQWS